MTSLRIKIKQKDSIEAYLDDVRHGVVDSLVGIVGRTANRIKQDTKDEMKNGKKTGRIYNYLGRNYRASAEGEVPAVRSGDLFRSIRVQRKNGGLTAVIGTPITYAVYLKKKRPILDFGLEKNSARFLNEIRRVI